MSIVVTSVSEEVITSIFRIECHLEPYVPAKSWWPPTDLQGAATTARNWKLGKFVFGFTQYSSSRSDISIMLKYATTASPSVWTGIIEPVSRLYTTLVVSDVVNYGTVLHGMSPRPILGTGLTFHVQFLSVFLLKAERSAASQWFRIDESGCRPVWTHFSCHKDDSFTAAVVPRTVGVAATCLSTSSCLRSLPL